MLEKLKAGFIKAQDVCDIVVGKKMQGLFLQIRIQKLSISQLIAQRWLAKLKWHYSKVKNGMYINGHKQANIMAYREAFIYC